MFLDKEKRINLCVFFWFPNVHVVLLFICCSCAGFFPPVVLCTHMLLFDFQVALLQHYEGLYVQVRLKYTTVCMCSENSCYSSSSYTDKQEAIVDIRCVMVTRLESKQANKQKANK